MINMHRSIFGVIMVAALTIIGGVQVAQANTDLLVCSQNTNQILRYNVDTNSYVGVFVPAGSGGLSRPVCATYGPDNNLYVLTEGDIKKYDGQTGTYIGDFVLNNTGGMDSAQDMVFGPNGDLYVTNRFTGVKRFDGVTGAYIEDLATEGGITYALGITFGPNGYLYVTDYNLDVVKKFDGQTGAYLGNFTYGATTDGPYGITFGPDGNLYVGCKLGGLVQRFNGTTGAFIDTFFSSTRVYKPVFDQDHRWYATYWDQDRVYRYSSTGSYIDTFINGGPVDGPKYLCFMPVIGSVTLTDFVGNFYSARVTKLLGTAPNGIGVNFYDHNDEPLAGTISWDGSNGFSFAPNTPLSSGSMFYAAFDNGYGLKYSRTHVLSFNDMQNVFKDDTVTYGNSGYSLRLEQDTSHTFKLAVTDAGPVTVSAWLQYNSDYGTETKPTIQLTGLGLDGTGNAAAVMSDGIAHTWESLSVEGTPAGSGVLELTVTSFSSQGGAACWIDEISVAQ